MKHPGESIPRRAFLSGAASLLGASTLGAVPGLGQAVAHGPALAAYFWNGSKFVPLAASTGQPNAQPTVQVQIQEIMGSASPVALDAVLPGGTFHAYLGSPQGSGRAKYPAPYAGAGVSLAASVGAEQQTFTLAANGALGFYLLVSATQPVGSLMLIQGTETTVIDSRGVPLGTPTILIEIS